MFSLQLSSSARWVPSAVSHLIINRGALCHLAARVSVLLAAGTQAPQCQVDSTPGPGVSRAAPGSPECPPQALFSGRTTAHRLDEEAAGDGGADSTMSGPASWPEER